jgi:hypothetical protein
LGFHGQLQRSDNRRHSRLSSARPSAKSWVVYCKRPFGGAEHVLRYLGGYTHRVAISNHRLLSLQDGKVTFRWRDSAHHNQQRRLCLPVEEFLRRFLLHVLPPGFVRIRHFGILSTRNRCKLLPLCRHLIEADPPPRGRLNALPEPAVQQPGLWRCPQCGGPMLLVERLTAGQLRFRSPPLQTVLSAV